MELHCKSIGYYKHGNGWIRGPLVINSDKHHHLEDNFTIKYIGGAPIILEQSEQSEQINETQPAHTRYYTISEENPLTIVCDTHTTDVTDLIISFKILSSNDLKNPEQYNSSVDIIPNKRVVLIEPNQQISIEICGINDIWENTLQQF